MLQYMHSTKFECHSLMVNVNSCFCLSISVLEDDCLSLEGLCSGSYMRPIETVYCYSMNFIFWKQCVSL
jgi:hypothetical protein